jgi:DNA repair protein RadC
LLPIPYEVPRYRVCLVREPESGWGASRKISTPADVAAIMEPILAGLDREACYVLLLDTKNQVMGLNLVSLGILDSSLVHPREVFKPAVLLGAAAVMLLHNHPSGDPTPSLDDRRVTERIAEAGRLLGIDLMDHIVLGEAGRWVSLKERGML